MFEIHLQRLKHAISALLCSALLAGCMGSDEAGTANQSTASGSVITPAERPEDVECVGSSVRKQAFFGDLHIHTKLSFDAYFFNSINGPREAYQFAKGENAFLPSG